MHIKLDSVTPVPFPDSAAWAAMYARFFAPLVDGLNPAYCLADREDAVAGAFYKLAHRKDRASYEKEPQTEAEWFHAIRWQARAALSHLRERIERHAKYVDRMAKALADAFMAEHQGEEMDAEIRSRALERALESFRREQDVSCRDLDIYKGIATGSATGRELAARHQVSEENVYTIKHRVGHLLRKHGPRHFGHALKMEGYLAFISAA